MGSGGKNSADESTESREKHRPNSSEKGSREGRMAESGNSASVDKELDDAESSEESAKNEGGNEIGGKSAENEAKKPNSSKLQSPPYDRDAFRRALLRKLMIAHGNSAAKSRERN